jgi:hypothetical protein
MGVRGSRLRLMFRFRSRLRHRLRFRRRPSEQIIHYEIDSLSPGRPRQLTTFLGKGTFSKRDVTHVCGPLGIGRSVMTRSLDEMTQEQLLARIAKLEASLYPDQKRRKAKRKKKKQKQRRLMTLFQGGLPSLGNIGEHPRIGKRAARRSNWDPRRVCDAGVAGRGEVSHRTSRTTQDWRQPTVSCWGTAADA